MHPKNIILIFFYFLLNSCTTTTSKERTQNLIDESRKSFNQNIENLQKINQTYYTLDSLITVNDFRHADLLIDSSSIPDNEKFDFRGQIEFKKGNTRKSIDLFSQSIALSNSSNYKAIVHRGLAYSQIGLFDSAISNIRPIALMNNDYSLQLASTYEQMGKSDSAIKYYRSFLADYRDDSMVIKKIIQLKNGR
jgi:tetratricopeptide (TPR) repeat protein